MLREIDSRVRFLSKRLEKLKVVSDKPSDPNKVYFGAWVTIEDDNGEQARYRIVGPDELDLKQGLISIDSPLARALLGKELDAGDGVVVALEAGSVPRAYNVPEQARLGDRVPHDHAGILAAACELDAGGVEREAGHGALVAIEREQRGVCALVPDADRAVRIADGEAVLLRVGRARERRDGRAEAELVPRVLERAELHVPHEYVLERREICRLPICTENAVGAVGAHERVRRGRLVPLVRPHHGVWVGKKSAVRRQH